MPPSRSVFQPGRRGQDGHRTGWRLGIGRLHRATKLADSEPRVAIVGRKAKNMLRDAVRAEIEPPAACVPPSLRHPRRTCGARHVAPSASIAHIRIDGMVQQTPAASSGNASQTILARLDRSGTNAVVGATPARRSSDVFFVFFLFLFLERNASINAWANAVRRHRQHHCRHLGRHCPAWGIGGARAGMLNFTEDRGARMGTDRVNAVAPAGSLERVYGPIIRHRCARRFAALRKLVPMIYGCSWHRAKVILPRLSVSALTGRPRSFWCAFACEATAQRGTRSASVCVSEVGRRASTMRSMVPPG